jgi:hypothetical protein
MVTDRTAAFNTGLSLSARSEALPPATLSNAITGNGSDSFGIDTLKPPQSVLVVIPHPSEQAARFS